MTRADLLTVLIDKGLITVDNIVGLILSLVDDDTAHVSVNSDSTGLQKKRKYNKKVKDKPPSKPAKVVNSFKCADCNFEFQTTKMRLDVSCSQCASTNIEDNNPSKRRGWSEEDDEIIKTRKNNGVSNADIAQELNRTPTAIVQRYYKIR